MNELIKTRLKRYDNNTVGLPLYYIIQYKVFLFWRNLYEYDSYHNSYRVAIYQIKDAKQILDELKTYADIIFWEENQKIYIQLCERNKQESIKHNKELEEFYKNEYNIDIINNY
jgi:preprotein translocase subunit SecA